MKTILMDAATRSIRYLETLDQRGVSPTPAAIAGLRAFDEPFPEKASDPAETLRLLDEVGIPSNDGDGWIAGFFGFVIGGALSGRIGSQLGDRRGMGPKHGAMSPSNARDSARGSCCPTVDP